MLLDLQLEYTNNAKAIDRKGSNSPSVLLKYWVVNMLFI